MADKRPEKRPLAFDPVAEAKRQWDLRWSAGEVMAAATSIMRAQQIVVARVSEALRPFDLTFARYEALVLLLFSRQGSLPMGKMGERLMVHPTSVTNIVDRLEAQEFVKRVPHPTDRRTILVEITAEGRDVAEAATEAVEAASFGLDTLSDGDVKRLTDVLRRLRKGAGDFDD